MNFFTWLGIIVAGLAFLSWFVPTLFLEAQFWKGIYDDMARARQRRRDKKTIAEVKSLDIR